MTPTEEGSMQHVAVTIRDFQPEDYPAIVEIENLAYPEHPTTVEERRFEDETFDRKTYVWRRYVAVEPSTNTVVGEADYNHLPWAYNPARFGIWFAVHPQWRRRGIGSLLYEKVVADLQSHGATQLRSWTQETQSDTIGWLRRRGYGELHRTWESRLDARGFGMGAFRGYWDSPAGIEIVTLAEELARDPECLKELYEMHCELAPDEPRVDPFTRVPFETWREWVINSPRSLPDAFFIAKAGDRYVGQSDLRRSEQLSDVLYTGFTGVRREYRGRGIAMALKLRAIDYAKRHGHREIRTWNSTLNAPMLGINVRLGFVKQPVWITFGKDLTTE